MAKLVERRQILVPQSITIVEPRAVGGRVESRALADEAGLTERAGGGTLAEREQQRDLGAAVEGTLRVVPAVERECEGEAAIATQQVREPQRRRGVRVDHPERRAIPGGQRGCERHGAARRRVGRRDAE